MGIRKILNLFRNSKALFKNMWNESPQQIITVSENVWYLDSSVSSVKNEDKRIETRPIEIYEKIISENPEINLKDLDKQINIVEQRMKDLKKHLRGVNLIQEAQALQYLQSRKKYEKNKDKFKWAITNADLIGKLCKEYKVRLVDISGYYRNVPTEGVDEIKKFAEAVEYVTNAEPTFKLIIDDNGKETKKDPILLATSPFGNWYYILGAWDKEVEIVDDLIYKRK